MSTKEREFKPSKRKTKKLNSKTRDSDENQALAKEKNDFLRQIDFLNSMILDTKLKESKKSKAHFEGGHFTKIDAKIDFSISIEK
ncbi:hypothetical protein TNCV_965201 [Trichonephila clavipes]|nr:hypothetical protein TNCV_965201 [Trichonephila clavipes]